jgi:hypothetical protein
LLQLPHPAAGDVNGDAALEIALAADLGVLLQELPFDADILHPMHGGVGFVDERLRQRAVHAALGHAVEVGEEILARIRRDVEGAEILLIDVGHEVVHFLGPGMGKAETGA